MEKGFEVKGMKRANAGRREKDAKSPSVRVKTKAKKKSQISNILYSYFVHNWRRLM